MLALYGKSGGRRAAVSGRFGGLLGAVVVATGVQNGPAAAGDVARAGDHLALRVDPKVDRAGRFHPPTNAEVGLESMLRARAATAGPDLAVEAGHYGAARPKAGSQAIQHRFGLQARVTDLLALSSQGVAADVVAGYRTGEAAAFDTGRVETRFELRADPAEGLAADTEVGWWGARQDHRRTWDQGGHGRLGVSYVWPGIGTIGAFERLNVSGPRGETRSSSTGLQLDLGAHRFSVTHSFETARREPAAPPATAAAYGWQVGPLAMALSADYAAASETEPASGFAGLAVTFGFAGPDPDALLDALR